MAQTLADISSTKDAGIYVCERLGYPDEAITEGSPEFLPNVLLKSDIIVIIATSNS
jgi:precorrin-6B methylase 1